MRTTTWMVCWGWLVAVGGCASGDQPDVPLASLGPVSGALSGDAGIRFTVSDPDSRLVNAEFRFGSSPGVDTPATRAAAGEELRGLSTSPEGVEHTFLWDTQADVGLQRLDSVYLAVALEAGAIAGVGDEIGPLVVDNTGLHPIYAVSGDVRRSGSPLGTQVGDIHGKLYLGVFSDPSYPPTGAPVATLDLGDQDLAETSASVPFAFPAVEPGNYQLIGVLDDNNNNIVVGGFSVDAGDLTNLGGTTIQVVSADVAQDVTLNYFYTP